MSSFRLEVHAMAADATSPGMDSLYGLASSSDHIDLLEAWRDEVHGEYLVIEGDDEGAITDLVESSGLVIDELTRVAAGWNWEIEGWPRPQVWCGVHSSFHDPPPH